jgi:hypothetical protein
LRKEQVGKEDWLLEIGERIAHAKVAEVAKESRCGNVGMLETPTGSGMDIIYFLV